MTNEELAGKLLPIVQFWADAWHNLKEEKRGKSDFLADQVVTLLEMDDKVKSDLKNVLDRHRPESTKPKVVQFQEDAEGYITVLMDNGEMWQIVTAGQWQRIEGPGESDEG